MMVRRLLLLVWLCSIFPLRAGDSDQMGLPGGVSRYSLVASVGVATIIVGVTALRYSSWARYYWYKARKKTVLDAISRRDSSVVQQFFNHGATPFWHDDQNETLLHTAARSGDVTTIKILLKHKSPWRNGDSLILERNEAHYRAIDLAALLGHEEAIRSLSRAETVVRYDRYARPYFRVKIRGAQTRCYGSSGGGCALSEGSEEESVSLTACRGQWNLHTALHYASEQGHENIARLLIGKGYPVNLPGKNKWTPLHCAIVGDHEDVVRLLVCRGAKIDARALELSSGKSCDDTLRMLFNSR